MPEKGKKQAPFQPSLYVQWASVVAEDTVLAKSESAVAQLVRDLVASQDQPWQKQTNLLKELVKQCKKAGKQDRSLIDGVVSRLAGVGYCYASENYSRRLFIPVLQISSMAMVLNEYTGYLSADDGSVLTSDAHKACCIQLSLDFDLGRQLLSDAFLPSLSFLVDRLIVAHGGCTGGGGDEDEALGKVHYLTKTLMSLLTRSDASAKRLSLDNIEHIDLLAQLVRVLLDIAMRAGQFGRDCSQVAAMAFGAVINLENDPQAVMAWVIDWFITPSAPPGEKTTAMADQWQLELPLLQDDRVGWQGPDHPLLFLMRGFISSLRKDVLLLPFEAPMTIPALETYGPCHHLLELFFAGFHHFCDINLQDAQAKVIAFDAMATWLLRLHNMMRQDAEPAVFEAANMLTNANVDRLIQHVCNYWDDPLDVMQHKMRNIFEMLLTILDTRTTHFDLQDGYKAQLTALLNSLLQTDWHRKVKYALMSMLIPKTGAAIYFELEPELIWKCVRAMDSLSLAPQITSFIFDLLTAHILAKVPEFKPIKGRHLKLVTDDENVQTIIDEWVQLWAMPVLRGLTSASHVQRQNVSGNLLQQLFMSCGDAFWHMLSILNDTKHDAWNILDSRYRLHAIIASLKVARSLELVDGSVYATDSSDLASNKISVETLKLALYHSDDEVRIDAFGLLCESRKNTATVTEVELALIKYFLALNMNCSSPSFRQRLCAHLAKLLARLHGNLYAQHRLYVTHVGYVPETDAQMEAAVSTVQRGKAFLHWLVDHLASSLYPGASFQRVATALRLFHGLVKQYGVYDANDNDDDERGSDSNSSTPAPVPSAPAAPATKDRDAPATEFPFVLPLATPRNTKLLLDTLMDPYDFNRNLAFDILCTFPNPLPGLAQKDHAQQLLWWALRNVVSTRAAESDSGAIIFRLIFNKYVLGLGYHLVPQQSDKPLASQSKKKKKNKKQASVSAAVTFTERLLDMLQGQVDIAKSNLLLAAQQHPMHGTLLTLQYVLREIDYEDARIAKDKAKWKELLARMMQLIHTVCDSVMDVLSNPSPEGNVPASFKEMEEAIDQLVGNDDDGHDDDDDAPDASGPKHQVILSCCWRAVKEASSLLEVIIGRTPVAKDNTALLTNSDLEKSGALLRTLLTSIRHRGAFSAVYPTYVTLCARLLSSKDAALNTLPRQWLQKNLESMTSSSISITRRSAGLPLCILAIVSSESLSKKELLHETFRRLLDLAQQPPPADADQRIDLPQVHAFNIMRTMFMDSKLGSRVLEFASDGFFMAIDGFSSASWAIRNCSVMLFSTLLQRTLGTKKTRDEHSTINNVTGQEFFTRFPKLHPYLLKELKTAVGQLLDQSLTENVHPGLYPMLTLLSRLRPSVMDDPATNPLSMAQFVPLVMSCSASSIFKTREMAARALVPLVPSTALILTVAELLQWDATLSQNDIHGRLLQVQFLLRGHLYHGALDTTLYEFIKSIPGVVHQCLLYLHRLNNVSQALLLDIVTEFFMDDKWLVNDKPAVLSDELIALSDEALETLRGFVLSHCSQAILAPPEPHQIGSYLMRQSMATILIHGYTKFGLGDLHALLFLLNDPDYEVRLTTMTKLMEFFASLPVTDHIQGINELQLALVQKTYHGESNLHCFAKATEFLTTLKPSQPYPKQLEKQVGFSLDEYWQTLLKHFVEKQSILVTESILPLLGALLSQVRKIAKDEKKSERRASDMLNRVFFE
ncbi:putative death-receptor fusion protein-domain-containing protein [Gongronella butleri]|nr:putative death-receptor fusion protein-domain-containing protein [Gongronella butleri]